MRVSNVLPALVTAPIVGQEPVETTFSPGKAMLGKICEKY